MKRFNLSAIMSEAHRIVSITGMTLSEALKKAWMNAKLLISMKKRVCHFFYKKISGEVREAYGTMMDRVIEGKVNGNGKRGKDCFTYYDTAADGFRCFKTYNIIAIG